MGRILFTAMLLAFLAFFMPQAARANCTSPDAKEGTQEYFSAEKIFKFCDGTKWVSFATASPGSGGGITVQFTTATYKGNLGGTAGATAKCQSEFPGSYFCPFDDYLRAGIASPPPAWVSSDVLYDAPPGPFEGLQNISCNGWVTYHFMWGGFSTIGSSTSCNNQFPIACCTRQ